MECVVAAGCGCGWGEFLLLDLFICLCFIMLLMSCDVLIVLIYCHNELELMVRGLYSLIFTLKDVYGLAHILCLLAKLLGYKCSSSPLQR